MANSASSVYRAVGRGARGAPIRLFHQHLRFWIALVVGIGGFFSLPGSWSFDERMLVGWDGAVTLFLAMIYLWMAGMTAEEIRSRYVEEDPSAPVILVVVIAASILSVVAIVEPLATLRHVAQPQRTWRIVLAAVTLVDSWLLVPTMFTMHYADMFYSAAPGSPPLSFPRTTLPTFGDFSYFSFTIAAACQTADVSTTETPIRRVVIVHEIIAFAFNVAIIGFAINITAGLIAS